MSWTAGIRSNNTLCSEFLFWRNFFTNGTSSTLNLACVVAENDFHAKRQHQANCWLPYAATRWDSASVPHLGLSVMEGYQVDPQQWRRNSCTAPSLSGLQTMHKSSKYGTISHRATQWAIQNPSTLTLGFQRRQQSAGGSDKHVAQLHWHSTL